MVVIYLHWTPLLEPLSVLLPRDISIEFNTVNISKNKF